MPISPVRSGLLIVALLLSAAHVSVGFAQQPSLLTDAGREELRDAFKTAIDEGLIAGGSLLLLQNDQTIFNEAFGFADLESRRPFETDTIAHLASTSKPHTATLLMLLVDEGLIKLDEPVSTYVPELKGIKLKESGEVVVAPTMRQLLSHTAGFEGLAENGYDKVVRLVFPHDTFARSAAAIADDGLAYRPGTDYRYTQFGMVVAAHVAETVTGKDWETLFREKLADPIGATRSTWYPSPTMLDNMAMRYNHTAGKLTPVAARPPRARGLPIDPAASLVADMDGVARLFLLHKNLGVAGGRRLLSESSIREMHKPQPAAPGYGLGLNLRWLPTDGSAAIVSHGGAHGTMAWADLETGIVGVIFIQTRPRQIPRWGELIYPALQRAGVGRMMDVSASKAKAGPPTTESITSSGEAGSTSRGETMPIVEPAESLDAAGIVRHLDLRYDTLAGVDAGRQSLDVYTQGGLKQAPVVVFVHGGSWQRGDKRAVASKPLTLVPNGFVTVSTNYRFRPQVSVAEMARDIAMAVAWVKSNIADYGGDPDRVFLMGHSAGAHLVSVVGTNMQFLNSAGVSPQVIKGVISLDTGPYDVPKQMRNVAADSSYGQLMELVFSQDQQSWDAVSPIHNLAPTTPPFLVISSDHRRDAPTQAVEFVKALQAQGVAAEWYEAEGLDHGGVNREIGKADNAITQKVLEFLRARPHKT